MIRKIVVNGTEYDSPDAMPPDVRAEYERALRLVQDIGRSGGLPGKTEQTVETMRDGVSIKVRTKQVKYTVDGKTYDDPAQLSPDVRARVEQALQQDGRLRDTQIANVSSEVESRSGVPRIVWWLLLGALAGWLLLRLNT